ncbi:hypothetical protein BJ170DRAFT_680963 [Xylariales sp. AK1849]|nr:hypothetical protein BJ170DRAFT_680963 [Xylariales sp. AK1849]
MPSSSHHHTSSRHTSSSHSSSSHGSTVNTPWQDRLVDYCHKCGYDVPDFLIVSDRRGGRTAWSSIVTVCNQQIKARFWYDGRNLTNAKEDAAEAALLYLEQAGW